ncbi:MAG: hypothetical protein JW839_00760, partial [Candidatus Lokiarchaeota archaeon]|nr:hypothetical protein [Candidatus Lokiarchaeota archaeon]
MEVQAPMTSPVPAILDAIRLEGAAASKRRIEELNVAALDEFLEVARRASDARFGKIIKAYVPGTKFPSISVTGTSCDLHCWHCQHHYLRGMIPAETPATLAGVLAGIEANGGTGALVSGGSTRDGVVEMSRFHDVLRQAVRSTGLALNLHTGLIDEATARSLRGTGISAISLDLVGDDATIRDIYGLDKTVEDYKRVLRGLLAAGFTSDQIVPHVCIGLAKGKVVGEYAVLDYIAELDPKLVVFIVIIPPKHREGHGFEFVPPAQVARVMATARVL